MSILFKRCPSCGRRFGVQLVKKESESQDVQTGQGTVNIGPRGVMRGVSPMAAGEDIETETYRCSTCGNTWSEKRVKEWRGRLPKNSDWKD